MWAPRWWQQDQEGLNPSINLGGEVCIIPGEKDWGSARFLKILSKASRSG